MSEKAAKRLDYELDVIDELTFTDYFLVVWDIVKEAKRRGMMTQRILLIVCFYCLD
jgi:DNA polymerase III alpha subunit